MTVNAAPEIEMTRPTVAGSRSNRRVQYPSLSIATGCPFGNRSSSGPITRPAIDVTVDMSRELAVAELVAAGLLRRRDVHVVERRRFAAAVAAERSGQRRRRGAPPAGVSPGADFIATAVWVQLTPDQSSVEIRLVAARTGATEGTARVALGAEDDPVAIARSIVTALLRALDDVGRLPAWEDPMAGADGTTTSSRVADATLRSFLQGLAAEEIWDWEGARRGYQAATGDQAFFEAAAALARAARLRLGGTLGEN